MIEPWDNPGSEEDYIPTPEELEAIKKRMLARLQAEHDASVKRQRMRMRPMDRSNVVPKK